MVPAIQSLQRRSSSDRSPYNAALDTSDDPRAFISVTEIAEIPNGSLTVKGNINLNWLPNGAEAALA